MKLSIPQQTISNSGARFRVAVCGRRFGKTFLAMNEIAKVARYPHKQVYAVYPTYRQAKTVLWDELKTRLSGIGWVKKVNETDLSLQLINNSKISLRGADNFDSLRGVGLDAVVMDEFQLVDQKAWTEVLRPALSDRKGNALFIGTPYGTANWAYDLWQRGNDPTEEFWESFSYTTIDGGNVSQDEIDQAMRDLDVRTFRQEYLASFESYANRLFYAFNRKNNIRVWNKPIPKNIHVSMDFNVGQMSVIIFVQEGKIAHAINELSITSSNTFEVVQELKSRYPDNTITVYPDPAGSARKTSAASGVTDHSILRNAGFLLKAPNAHTPVRDGINAVNAKLCSATNESTLFIDPHCKKTIESLEKHSYKEGTSQPDKDSGFDHFSDSLRYYIDYVFPIRRNVPDYVPTRWGHAIG